MKTSEEEVVVPNAETAAAMRETRSGENLSSYDSFDEMRTDLDPQDAQN